MNLMSGQGITYFCNNPSLLRCAFGSWQGETCADSSDVFLFAAGRGRQPVDIRLSVMAVTRRGRGRQPVDIRLSVMAVTRRGLPLENVKGVRKRWR
ncbi:UNVERIFIED_CONTAM: hypothetical protein FKN15_016852 [Acipenser sinensis]